MVRNYNSVTLCLFVVYIVYMCIGSISSCYPFRVPLLLNELTSVLYTHTIFIFFVYCLYVFRFNIFLLPPEGPFIVKSIDFTIYTHTIFRHVYTLYHVSPLFCKVAVLEIKEMHNYVLILYFIKKGL